MLLLFIWHGAQLRQSKTSVVTLWPRDSAQSGGFSLLNLIEVINTFIYNSHSYVMKSILVFPFLNAHCNTVIVCVRVWEEEGPGVGEGLTVGVCACFHVVIAVISILSFSWGLNLSAVVTTVPKSMLLGWIKWTCQSEWGREREREGERGRDGKHSLCLH